MSDHIRQHRIGIIYTTIAFSAWGVLPIYWKVLGHVPAIEILAHRILWSFVFASIVLVIRRNAYALAIIRDRRNRKLLLATGILIGINWFTYVFAVNSERLVEASMGYYINPLLSVFLGLVVLKERLNLLQVVAFVLACAGVIYLTVEYGKLPWIALLLASAFALYGLLKKKTKVEPMRGLMIETLVLLPLAIAIIMHGVWTDRGALFSVSPVTDLLLIFAGIVTVMPLFWFAQGARRIPLSSVGFLQYIAPSLMLLIGVFIFREPFTHTHAVSFICIWIALALYSLTLARKAIV